MLISQCYYCPLFLVSPPPAHLLPNSLNTFMSHLLMYISIFIIHNLGSTCEGKHLPPQVYIFFLLMMISGSIHFLVNYIISFFMAEQSTLCMPFTISLSVYFLIVSHTYYITWLFIFSESSALN